MTDLFHEDVPFDFIDNVFAVMDCCPQHTFIILTKRAERMYEYYAENRSWRVGQLKYAYKDDDCDLSTWPLPNVWMLVSAEDQKTFDLRVDALMDIPAVVRGVSIEPQLGPINMFSRFESNEYNNFWILNGGESGNKARPPHPDWFRTIRDQCKYAGIPYFFKQHGEWAPEQLASENAPFMNFGSVTKVFHHLHPDGSSVSFDDYTPEHNHDRAYWMAKVGKHESGNLLDGVQHLEFPA